MSQRTTRNVRDGAVSGGEAVEFDFQKMLEGFDKARLAQEATGKLKAATTYNKTSSFFDTLDEEATDETGRRGRSFMAEMRKVDAETFGEELIRERRPGGGGRGRGRGGGGGGRGRPQGGGRGGGENRPQSSAGARLNKETFGDMSNGSAPLGSRGGGGRGGGGRADGGKGNRSRGGGGRAEARVSCIAPLAS